MTTRVEISEVPDCGHVIQHPSSWPHGRYCPTLGVKLLIDKEKLTQDQLANVIGNCARGVSEFVLAAAIRAHLGVL